MSETYSPISYEERGSGDKTNEGGEGETESVPEKLNLNEGTADKVEELSSKCPDIPSSIIAASFLIFGCQSPDKVKKFYNELTGDDSSETSRQDKTESSAEDSVLSDEEILDQFKREGIRLLPPNRESHEDSSRNTLKVLSYHNSSFDFGNFRKETDDFDHYINRGQNDEYFKFLDPGMLGDEKDLLIISNSSHLERRDGSEDRVIKMKDRTYLADEIEGEEVSTSIEASSNQIPSIGENNNKAILRAIHGASNLESIGIETSDMTVSSDFKYKTKDRITVIDEIEDVDINSGKDNQSKIYLKISVKIPEYLIDYDSEMEREVKKNEE